MVRGYKETKKISSKLVYLTFFMLMIILLLPDLLGLFLVDNYTLYNYKRSGDETIYGPRIKDAYEGKLFVETPVVKEESDQSILRIINPLIVGLLARLFGFLDYTLSIILVKSILIFIAVFLLYMVFLKIFNNKNYSLLCTTIFSTAIFPNNVLILIVYYLSNFIGDKPVIEATLYFSSLGPLKPIPAFIFSLLAILSYFKLFEKKKQSLTILVATGFIWSLIMYTNVFDAIGFYVAVTLVAIYFFLNKDAKYQKMLISLIATGVFLIPYLISYVLTYFNNTTMLDLVGRLSIESGRFIRILLGPYIIIFVGIMALYLFKKQIKKEWYVFLSAILIAAIIGSNIQLILGKSPQPGQWISRFLRNYLKFAFFTLLFPLLQMSSKHIKKDLIKFVSFFGILITLFLSLLWNYVYFNEMNSLGKYTLTNEEFELYDYINKNFKDESVIMTDDISLNFHIPIYTNNYVFIPNGFNTKISNKEILDRTFISFYMLGYSPNEVQNMFAAAKLPGYLFHFDYHPKTTDSRVVFGYLRGTGLRQEDLDNFYTTYQEMSKKEVNNPYLLDYIITQRNIDKIPLKNSQIIREIKFAMYNIYEVN